MRGCSLSNGCGIPWSGRSTLIVPRLLVSSILSLSMQPSPTPALIPHCRRESRPDAQQLNPRVGIQSTIWVGYAPSLVSDLLPKAIAHFKILQRNVRVDLVDITPKEICERAAKGLIDVAIIPRGVESRLRGVELIEITRLDPVLVVPKGHRLARLSKIPPRILQNVHLYGLGRRDFPEYAPRLRAILKPYGVVPALVSQTSDGVASLFAKMIADNGASVLTEGVVDSLPASLVARPFRPALPPLVILAALFVSRPSLNAEGFVRQLKEEAERGKKPRVTKPDVTHR